MSINTYYKIFEEIAKVKNIELSDIARLTDDVYPLMCAMETNSYASECYVPVDVSVYCTDGFGCATTDQFIIASTEKRVTAIKQVIEQYKDSEEWNKSLQPYGFNSPVLNKIDKEYDTVHLTSAWCNSYEYYLGVDVTLEKFLEYTLASNQKFLNNLKTLADMSDEEIKVIQPDMSKVEELVGLFESVKDYTVVSPEFKAVADKVLQYPEYRLLYIKFVAEYVMHNKVSIRSVDAFTLPSGLFLNKFKEYCSVTK